MITDTELKLKGLKALTKALGAVEAEKFVALILREPFDYTKWQRELWPGKTVEEVSKAATKYRRLFQDQRKESSRRTRNSSKRGKPPR